MKLKKRPKSYSDEEQSYVYPHTYEEWFKEFEKEIPAKLDKLIFMLNEWLIDTQGVTVAPSVLEIRNIVEQWSKEEILEE